MNKTKNKIILAAVKLYNKKGMFNVLNAEIAKETGISLSNFNYHFKTKADLVYEVCGYMRTVIEEKISSNQVMTKDKHALSLTKIYLEFELDFRFFYLDTHNILKTFPKIKKEMHTQIKESIQIIKNVNYLAIGKGYMLTEPEDMPGLYDQLAHQIWINSHFWLAQANIRGKKKLDIIDGLDNFYALVYPYLTKKGKSSYRTYIDSLKAKTVALN